MSTGSDAADQMVKETVYFTSEAAKLVGVGAKNLAALLLALARDHQQLKGKTSIEALLKSTEQPKVVRIKILDLADFRRNARMYGVQFAAIRDKRSLDGICDVIVPVEKISQVNRILEKMGYAIPSKEEEAKNGKGADQSERNSKRRDSSVKETMDSNKAKSASEKQSAQSGGYGTRLAAIKKNGKSTKSTAQAR